MSKRKAESSDDADYVETTNRKADQKAQSLDGLLQLAQQQLNQDLTTTVTEEAKLVHSPPTSTTKPNLKLQKIAQQPPQQSPRRAYGLIQHTAEGHYVCTLDQQEFKKAHLAYKHLNMLKETKKELFESPDSSVNFTPRAARRAAAAMADEPEFPQFMDTPIVHLENRTLQLNGIPHDHNVGLYGILRMWTRGGGDYVLPPIAEQQMLTFPPVPYIRPEDDGPVRKRHHVPEGQPIVQTAVNVSTDSLLANHVLFLRLMKKRYLQRGQKRVRRFRARLHRLLPDIHPADDSNQTGGASSDESDETTDDEFDDMFSPLKPRTPVIEQQS
eukprot:TRINITY_DN7232_c0_g1_i1.p1 TRINITY_DN7232_c0_g1~~TRINITY_DN7232_c0_g1_i1.p1  ORF type:complete len:357 (-),score=69.29 TRINITY_DN7232_c0_g1_i1:674-1657(-)